MFAIFDHVTKLIGETKRRVSTADLNRVLAEIVKNHTPALVGSSAKLPKFYYATQVSQSPPRIVVKTNIAGEIQESYRRYMNKQFKQRLGFKNIPIELIFRHKDQKRNQAADTGEHSH